MTTEAVSIVVAVASCLAAFMAAVAAWKMLKLEKSREKNRVLLLKHQSEVEHLEKLIASFARVIALDSCGWSDERNQNIDNAIQEMQLHISVLEALNTRISADVTQWVIEKDPDRKSIPQVVYYEIGQLHPTGHQASYKNFMELKMEKLKEIQDKMYSEMTNE